MSKTPALQGSALEQAGAIVTETSLKLADPTSLSWDGYERLGQFLGTLGRAYCWWVGDFLLYGEEIFGEEYSQIEATLPHSEQTLVNYRSIAKHIPPSRRRASLSFSVHEAVAYLEPRERDRWLDMAEREGWKREQMRAARREARAIAGNSGPVGEPAVTGDAAGVSSEPVPGPELCPHCGQPMPI